MGSVNQLDVLIEVAESESELVEILDNHTEGVFEVVFFWLPKKVEEMYWWMVD